MVLRGRRVRVVVRGGVGDTRDRRPLVLVNGIGASLELLDPLVDALDPGREVVRFDAPGIGGSPLPFWSAPPSIPALASLVVDLLDQLGHREADVLGLSWGGGIAQQLALAHRDRVGRLALVGTGTGVMMVPARLGVLATMLTPRRYNDRRYRREVGTELYAGERQDAVDAVFERARPVDARGYLGQLLALASWTSLPVLPWLTTPTLVLAGRRDPVVPVVNAHIMGAMLPRATVVVHDGGHLGLLTRPRELAPVVEEFLDRPGR